MKQLLTETYNVEKAQMGVVWNRFWKIYQLTDVIYV